MHNYRDILTTLAWRALIAAPFLYLAVTGYPLIISPLFGVVGAIIIAMPLARLLAEPVGNIFWSGSRYGGDEPLYIFPELRRSQGFYEEAIKGLEKIAEDYPGEIKPYIDMIDIAIVNLKDTDRANAIYKRGITVLKKNENKKTLAQMYSSMRNQLSEP